MVYNGGQQAGMVNGVSLMVLNEWLMVDDS